MGFTLVINYYISLLLSTLYMTYDRSFMLFVKR